MRGERAAATLVLMRTSLLVVLMLLPACAAPRLTSEQMISTPPKRLALASLEPRRTVTVLGVELAVHDSDPSGGKPAIFCLHAVGHGGSDFSAFERAFADRYRILTVDWPGQGARPVPGGARSFQRSRSDIPGGLALASMFQRAALVGRQLECEG